MSLPAEFTRHLRALGLEPGRALVAVSGGPDSVALLDLLCQGSGQHDLELIVAHADHGIHPASGEVAQQVETLARSHGVPAVTGRLELGEGTSETRARRARYEWLRATQARLDARWILTAHHADDQAETVLLRVLGGSGPAGLAGMSSVRGSLVRPLLPFRRAAVRGYVAERGLPHWNDPANTDPAHLRSWIRTELLPLLGRRESGPEQRILRLARQASVEREAWDLALDRLAGLAPRGEADGASADAGTLYRMPAPLRSTVLQALARRAGLVLGPQRAGRALRALDRSGSGSAADLGGGWRLERAFGRLRIVAPSPVPSDGAPLPSVSLEGETGAARWGEWRLSWSNEPAPPTRSQSRDGLTAWFIPDRLRVRGWQAGDRLFPLHGRGRRLAVRCFQEKRVPRSERAGWPLLEGAGGLLWIPGVCRSGAQVPEAGDPAMRIDVVRS